MQHAHSCLARARDVVRAALMLALMVCANANAAPCANFTDVDSAVVGPGFCANVEWLKNRQVTLGCTSTTVYCPDNSVTRLQMAAFMNRLGNALTPTTLTANDAPGAIDLDLNPGLVVCQTQTFTATGYPRTGFADASFSGLSTAATTFAADLVFTLNGGATWTAVNGTPNRSSTAANGYGNAADVGTHEIHANQSIRFGLRVSRGGVAGGTDLTDSRCQLRVLVYSRTGISSPF